MLVRITTHTGGDLEKILEIQKGRESLPHSGLPEGVTHAMILKGENRRLFVTLFESQEALDAAKEEFEAMGSAFPAEVRGERTSVEVFEVLYDKKF